MATIELLAIPNEANDNVIIVPKELKAMSERRYPNNPVVIGLEVRLKNKKLVLPVMNVKFSNEEGVIHVPANMAYAWKNNDDIVNVHLLDAGNYPAIKLMVVSVKQRVDGRAVNIDDIQKALAFPVYVAIGLVYDEPQCAFKIDFLATSDKHFPVAGFAFPDYTTVEIYNVASNTVISTIAPKSKLHTLGDIHEREHVEHQEKMKVVESVHKKIEEFFGMEDEEMPDAPSEAPQKALDFSRVKTREYPKLFTNNGEIVYVKK